MNTPGSTLPTRRQHFNDPFGLTLYRRLSLTENVAQYHQPGYTPLAIEQNAMLARRHQNAQDRQHGIPRIGYPVEQERREPNDLVTEHVLPSFARHLAKANATAGQRGDVNENLPRPAPHHQPPSVPRV